jgi:hypothetical protein
MIPVTLKVRSLDAKEAVLSEKDFHFNVFVHQKWTPTLMMMTLYNSISNLNDFADETTYRLNGKVEMNGPRNIGLATMQATAICRCRRPWRWRCGWAISSTACT